MIAAIILTIRLLAEERQTGTMILLSTSPVKDRDIVIGKFLAAYGVLALTTLLSVYMPAWLFVHG
jgi:ABC-2 type transport system permease protein